MKKIFETSWIFIILFFVLSLLDYRFGILALICMMTPIFFALKGEGRKGCNQFCPRGSLLSKLSPISLRRTVPKWFFTSEMKIGVFLLIMGLFIQGMYFSWGDFRTIGKLFFRMVGVSTIISIILGIVYRERTWCGVCPMGNLATEIDKRMKK
ncbi:MAG: 4Fe-4S binding protein [Fusobacteriaceae bacterium]